MGFPQASSLSGPLINDAVICNNKVLFTTYYEEQRMLRVLEIVSDNNTTPPKILYAPKTIRSWTRHDPEVTCIAMYVDPQYHTELIVAGQEKNGEVSLEFITGNNPQLHVPISEKEGGPDLRSLASIIITPSSTPDNFTLLCGSVTGLVMFLDIIQREEQFYIRGSRYDRFGGSVVTLTVGDQEGRSDFVFVGCDEKFFRMIPSNPNHNRKRLDGETTKLNVSADQVWLVDTLDSTLQQPNINSILPLRSESSSDTDILMVSDTRLLLARMGTRRKTVPRRIPLIGTPYRIIYSETHKALIVGASIDGRSTLYFVDPKTGENLSEPRDGKRGTKVNFVTGLGRFGDRVLCIYEWLYRHDDQTWSFFVVCTSDGKILIICTNNDSSVNSAERSRISFWTVTRFKNFSSVYSVVGDSDGLYYCAQSGTECKLYYSTLNQDDKKFNPNPAEVKLLSPAISLFYESGKIYALTRHHSLQIIEVIKNNGNVQLRHTHTDQLLRESLHHLHGRSHAFQNADQNQIDFVSDRSKSVIGLWASSGMRIDTLDTIFEAQLPASILRLRSSNCRPVWDSSWMINQREGLNDPTCLGVIHNDELCSETLGLGIDGSLYHFTMLDIRAWKFLKFLANLARRSGIVGGRPWEGPTDLEPKQDPRNMQIDGDILKRVMENRKLEAMFGIDEYQTDENKRDFKRFCELLNIRDEGIGMDEDPVFYTELAYDYLEVFLRPVI